MITASLHPFRFTPLNRLLTGVALVAALVVADPAAQSSGRADGRDADRAAIRKSIENITQAYLDGDPKKIYLERTEDWTGFLGRISTPVIGRDQFMKVQGLQYPPPTGTSVREPVNETSTIFRITNFDVNFVASDVGVAHLILEYAARPTPEFVPTSRMRITDVYAQRHGVWLQIASHSSLDPSWRYFIVSLPFAQR